MSENEKWRQRYLNLVTYCSKKGYLVSYCMACDAVIDQDDSESEDNGPDADDQVSITMTCPKCGHKEMI